MPNFILGFTTPFSNGKFEGGKFHSFEKASNICTTFLIDIATEAERIGDAKTVEEAFIWIVRLSEIDVELFGSKDEYGVINNAVYITFSHVKNRLLIAQEDLMDDQDRSILGTIRDHSMCLDECNHSDAKQN